MSIPALRQKKTRKAIPPVMPKSALNYASNYLCYNYTKCNVHTHCTKNGLPRCPPTSGPASSGCGCPQDTSARVEKPMLAQSVVRHYVYYILSRTVVDTLLHVAKAVTTPSGEIYKYHNVMYHMYKMTRGSCTESTDSILHNITQT